MVIDDDTDWAEVADLVTESYRICAPQRLMRLLDRATEQAPPSDRTEPSPGRHPERGP
jgi:hypothetical protein